MPDQLRVTSDDGGRPEDRMEESCAITLPSRGLNLSPLSSTQSPTLCYGFVLDPPFLPVSCSFLWSSFPHLFSFFISSWVRIIYWGLAF